jgi:vitamin B12 transporter
MNRKKLAIIMAAMLCSCGLQAEEASSGYVGEEVVVSATRTLNRISDAGGSSVTVITSKEIEKSGQATVEEVIKGSAGIDISSNGGPGASASVYLRGADSKYTLVLVDGVPFNDPSMMNAEANLANVMVDNIERIEIVRGPASMLYGSSAEAGVINIITKKGAQKASAFAGTEGGSYGTFRFFGGASGKKGPFDYSVTASRLKTDGISSADERNPAINPTGKSFEKDGYINSTFSGNFGLKLDDHVSVDTSLRFSDADNKYDNGKIDASGYTEKTKQFSTHTALKMNYQPLLSTLYYNVSDQDRNYDEPYGLTVYHGHIYEIGWQGDFAAASNNTISVGLASRKDSMSTTGIDPRAVISKSIFMQDQWSLGVMRLVGGIRFENNEQFGSKTTWRIAPSFTFGNTVVKVSYGTGFKAPSLYELYAPMSVGNDKLKAETSKGWDAGIEQKLSGNLKAGSTWFRTDFENRIGWAADYTLPWWGHYDQVPGLTKTYGVENFVEWQPIAPLFLTANYTWLNTRDANGNELLRRPKNKLGLTSSWKATDRLKLNTNMQWVGSRRDTGEVNGKLDSYFLVNLSASYKLAEHVEIFCRVDNLFDQDYELASGYATPGRSAYAGVKFGF